MALFPSCLQPEVPSTEPGSQLFGKHIKISLNCLRPELLILTSWGSGWREAPQSWQGQAHKPWGVLGVKRGWNSHLAGICFPLWVSSTQHLVGDFRAIVVGLLTLLVGNQLHNSHFQLLWIEIVS